MRTGCGSYRAATTRFAMLFGVLVGLIWNTGAVAQGAAGDDSVARAREIIAGAIDLTRGTSSVASMSMQIHRPDWDRTASLKAWTRGREDALIRFTAPARDRGSATLKVGEQMWTYTPRLNRTIRLPFSMMSQSWAGSDFSYHDLSRTDKLLLWYDHQLLEERTEGGHQIYVISAVPRGDAPVVWGREVLTIRDDYVLIEQLYYDQQGVVVKRLTGRDVGELGGRVMATRVRIERVNKPDQWTEVTYKAAEFDVDLSDDLFTQFALRSGG